ncbi:phospholipase D [Xylona heveae TC161]|uniref:Phospholipase D1 n=1 Tax=Xylona heveae (strain CBS 132557 / TC161) TaxID=1328760 RepID=A0A164ZGG6_XYLHT|nr:phospholipase D [Xylona heveae TC161]KZF19074.1 phospholipase D [Xylona heveae TC161]
MFGTDSADVSPRTTSPLTRSHESLHAVHAQHQSPSATNPKLAPSPLSSEYQPNGSLNGDASLRQPPSDSAKLAPPQDPTLAAVSERLRKHQASNPPNGRLPNGGLSAGPSSQQLSNEARKGKEQESIRQATDRASNLDHLSAEDATSPGRRSVQFARRPVTPRQSTERPRTRPSSRDADYAIAESPESSPKERKGSASLFSRIKAFSPPSLLQSHGRSPSGFTIGDGLIDENPTPALSPASERYPSRPMSPVTDEGSDADAEESATEGASGTATPRRNGRSRSRRVSFDGPHTAPTTPKGPSRDGTPAASPVDYFRPSFLRRRATMTDVPESERQGVSEDEGRDRLGKGGAWRRGSAWVHMGRGLSYAGNRKQDGDGTEGGEPRRPSNFRRITGFGGGHSDAQDGSPAGWRGRAERAPSLSAQKWRQLKAGLKMIGQKKKEESKIDSAKSAELLAELTAGIPAALIFASMFQRDEHGHKRIPILLEQLKVRITDSKKMETSGDRHVVFRIELEYGSGLTRMKWIIHRALRDFANLHVRYKLQNSTEKYIQFKEDSTRAKLPHFPRSAFPYLRGVRGLGSDEEEDDEADEQSAPEGAPARPGKKRQQRRPSFAKRRRSSMPGGETGAGTTGVDGRAGSAVGIGGMRKDTYHERQRRKLELYLQQMIRYLIFRAESNRLCKFLELSALGVRLAAESSYHGKEGFLIIQSGKGIDFRKAWKPGMVTRRHSPKWFLVRHSYVVCVDSPEEMNIYDVFLVDSDFTVNTKRKRLRDQNAKDLAKTAKDSATPQHHLLRLQNSERKMKLLAKNERQLHQFEESIRFMASNTIWSKKNRFDSFAPVRSNVFAQWLVDGRDYMWNVSRAISMARDVIYIHDWWLSPELYMRRPAAISQKWRLDRLLQRKAQEGVKVFVIMYRNINSAIPIDSEYTKFSLLDLHPNVFVQRSPNQFRQNTFFWAHHEKICIIDHAVAFMGGIDLCFGRWDTPQHPVVDDKLTGFEPSDMPKDADHCQLWPGKDYSNPRVQDFYALDRPYEEMYDRARIPRMPWHDIAMQLVGQPARDLTRHFVQRWNYILRQRRPTRPTPFLLPPPDFNAADLEALGLQGTCETQILRSASWWSLGTPDRTEHSIMNAYIKMIEQSDHFVYIENQFFVTSCEVEGTRIENLIGDALVERIVRADKNGEPWRAVIIIPLMPGFQNTVDSQDGTSVRLIMQCQYRSICRGEASIFARLRAAGIEPEDYIQFYSLRNWGKIGPAKQLVTEQLYIHAKCMIVDDRIAIIGSANINERSMLGSRDSEVACVIRDTDMLWSRMAGEPYMVGRFPHTLRMRLMREHLGLDVDEIMEEDRLAETEDRKSQWEREMDRFHDGTADSIASNSTRENKETMDKLVDSRHKAQDDMLAKNEKMFSFNHDVDWEQENNPNLRSSKRLTEDPRVQGNPAHAKDVRGDGFDHMNECSKEAISTARDSIHAGDNREVLVTNVADEGKSRRPSPPKPQTHREPSKTSTNKGSESSTGNARLPPPLLVRSTTAELGLPLLSQLPPLPVTDDTDIGGPPIQIFSGRAPELVNPLVADMRRPLVERDCMRDPLNDSFFLDTWHAVAENNTRLYRTVFRCMPDNEVKSWKEYKEYAAYSERFAHAQGLGRSKSRLERENAIRASGPPGAGHTAEKIASLGPIGEKVHDASATFLDKVPGKKNNHNNGAFMSDVRDLAAAGDRAQAEREAHGASKSSLVPSHLGDGEVADEKSATSRPSQDNRGGEPPHRTITISEKQDFEKPRKAATAPLLGGPHEPSEAKLSHHASTTSGTTRRRRRATTRSSRREFQASDDLIDLKDAEELMKMVQGHLVVWPYEWLAREEQGGNWLYSIDQLAPLEIYN